MIKYNRIIDDGLGLAVSVLDLIMVGPIQLQCIFSYTVLVNRELDPYALHTRHLSMLDTALGYVQCLLHVSMGFLKI